MNHVLNKTDFNVFQTFVDMEGSGFPDLESVRVRRTNSTLNSNKLCTEDVISVVVRLQPASVNSIDYCKLALCKRIPFFYYCRAHLADQAHLVRPVLLVPLQQAQD